MEVQSSNITITEEEFGYSQEVIKKLSDYFDAKVVGQQQLKFSLIGSILADGHILIESVIDSPLKHCKYGHLLNIGF